MPSHQIKERIKRIQKHLKTSADGIIGSGTLTLLENNLFSQEEIGSDKNQHSLTISQQGYTALIHHEIVSPKYYKKHLQKPVWPGGGSGITIGIGYDLGYNSPSQIKRDWQAYLSDKDLEKLIAVARKKGADAKQKLSTISRIKIPFEAANEVFSIVVLPRYAALTFKAYPGITKLLPDAQAALLSLVYNRGRAMSGSKRKEMKAIQALVKKKDYVAIASQIKSMKRLWEGKGLVGLLKRRDAEANLILNAKESYFWKNLIRV